MPTDPKTLDELGRMRACLPSGPVYVATGCSWRRILHAGSDIGVVVPCIAADGHPDLDATMAELEYLCALRNAAPSLLADAREAARLRERVAALESVVASLVDPDPCRFDHHGGCQAHGFLDLAGQECPNAAAHRLLTPEPR